MSLASHALSEGPVGWGAAKQKKTQDVPQSRRIVAAPAMATYRPEEFKPGPHYRTEDELAEAAGLIGTTPEP